MEPSCFSQTAKQQIWRDAISVEVNALLKHGTLSLVLRPVQANAVGCKWVYKVKTNPDGTLERCNARLVAKGYTQQKGVAYTETFSPVIKPTTIHTVLSLAVSCSWQIQQFDISNAFLNGDLTDEVYIVQTQGFIDSNHPNYVYRLHKSL